MRMRSICALMEEKLFDHARAAGTSTAGDFSGAFRSQVLARLKGHGLSQDRQHGDYHLKRVILIVLGGTSGVRARLLCSSSL